MNKLKVLELFGGIGACTEALKYLNINFEVVDYVEIDKYAVKSYNAINGTTFIPQDIKKWDKDLEVDLIMHGSPCQNFSIAGKGEGGDEGSGTNSSLMYETLRIVEKLRPRYVIWENVKNIISKKHIHNFNNYINRMREFGYNNFYKIINAKDHGVPQNRERVFTVSILGNTTYNFPDKMELKVKLKDILEDEVEDKYFLSDAMINCFTSNETGKYPRKERFLQNINRKNKDVGNAITALAGNRPTDNFIIVRGNYSPSNHSASRIVDSKGIAPTVMENHGTVTATNISETKIRKLTPRECWRLMGFSDDAFNRASEVCSNTQLYKQAGNSIVVNVLEAILKQLLEEGNNE